MSPRRSSRARIVQPPLSATNSSSSSVASGHVDRHARSSQKIASPRSSLAPRSQSSEERGSTQPPAQARRTRSSQDDAKDGATISLEDDHEDEGEAEEEVTRCICGNQEYPGLPVSPSDDSKGNFKNDPDSAILTEDATGWFIQCDTCHVWQHGGCVGLLDESTSPEEYYCEQCHPNLHKITSTANGYVPLLIDAILTDIYWKRRKHSHYIPIEDANSTLSSPAPVLKSNMKRSKDSKAAQLHAESLAKGRRSTMNSRDAAYEEEQLRRAIEESKREGGTGSTAPGTRKGKRSRDESEEYVCQPSLSIPFHDPRCLLKYLLQIGAPRTQSGSEQYRVLHPQIRKAKAVVKPSNPKTNLRSQSDQRTSVVPQLEITEIRKSEIGKS